MRFITLLFAVIGFMVGVGWRTFFEVSVPTLLLVVLLVGSVVLVQKQKNYTFSLLYQVPLVLFILFAVLGVVRTEVASWKFDSSQLENSLGKEVVVQGVVVREPEYREKSVQLSVQSENDLLLVTTDRLSSFSYGDKVIVTGKLERPEAFETELGRMFDYPGYLRAKGIEYRISFAEVEVESIGHGNFILSSLLAVKQSFIESIQNIIPEPEVGLGNGLLLGVKSALGEDIEDDFRRTGIIHIVVLSGYNVMLVVAFIMFCFSFLLPFRWRIAAGLVAIVAFALIVGLSATVVRASAMAGLVLLAEALGRRYDVLRALLLAGFLMVFINPYILVYDIGFQLSFMATLGLILIIPRFELLGLQKHSWFGVKDFFLSTLATQIAVLPLLMYHIGQVSVISLVVNVLVLPVVPFAMLLTFLAGVVGFFSTFIASGIGYFANLTLAYIIFTAGWFADVPFAAVTVPTFSPLGVLLLYAAMLTLWYSLRHWQRRPNNEYVDWTIEEEFDDGTIEGRKPTADQEQQPVFFR